MWNFFDDWRGADGLRCLKKTAFVCEQISLCCRSLAFDTLPEVLDVGRCQSIQRCKQKPSTLQEGLPELGTSGPFVHRRLGLNQTESSRLV